MLSSITIYFMSALQYEQRYYTPPAARHEDNPKGHQRSNQRSKQTSRPHITEGTVDSGGISTSTRNRQSKVA